jgi:fatty acid desaturase
MSRSAGLENGAIVEIAAARDRGQPIDWYWIPIEREVLAALSRKSDLLGAAQTLGFLATLLITGTAVYYSSQHWTWYMTLALLFLHGTCWAFLSNGFHEFNHGTVFATRVLNRISLYLFSFLSWNNPILFWASHTEHHKFTLYSSDDLEVSPDVRPRLREFLMIAFINPRGLLRTLTGTVRHARGRIEGEWEERLFPPSKPELRARLSRWAWILLLGHGAILLIAIYFRLWMLPVVISLAPFYGRGIQWLCNESQHTGLPGNVPDFRVCSRTVLLTPALQFLYWYMNYHTEHHFYAAVPCYRLAQLHREIERDMPPCPRGLIATWRQINTTLQRQKHDPDYRYFPTVPPRRTRSGAR